jgi:hypothetical protein
MIDQQMQEAQATLEALPLNGKVLTPEDFEKMFIQTPEDQGLTEDEQLPS